jgi:esterase/lipase superfamily enzyme
MKKWILLLAMIAGQAFGEYQVSQVQPVFIWVHLSEARIIRINTNQIRYYQEYYPGDDLYYGTDIFMVGNSNSISVIEKPDEIDLMLTDGYQKPKPKGKK